VLLADEVVAVGDSQFRQRCLVELERRTALGMTLLLASHNMDLVQRLCTDVILLDSGHVVEYGPVDDVVGRYAAISRAARAAPLNLDGSSPSLDNQDNDTTGKPLIEVAAAVYSATGQPVDLLASDEEAMIEIALDVESAPATLRCILGLASATARLQISQPFKFTVSESGRCYVSVRIPPGSLPSGSFRGRVTLLSFTDIGREVIDERRDAFSFEVLEPRNGDQAGSPRTGVPISPKGNLSLAWSVSEQYD
jgi:hypothetical protein